MAGSVSCCRVAESTIKVPLSMRAQPVRAVVVIETHRIEHNITDGRTAIGPEPPERDAYRSWHGASRTISDACELLTPGAVAGPQVVAARELPGLDIEI